MTTIEGLSANGQLHALQESFWAKHGLQCGFCTPGMIFAAHELLRTNPVADARADPARPRRQHVPLHRLPEHRPRRAATPPRSERSDERTTTGRIFGSGIRRREDPRLITGTARYTDDITLPGHGARGDAAQPARARAHHAASTPAARRLRPAWSRSTPAPTSKGVLKPMPCAWLRAEREPEDRGLPAAREGHRPLRRRPVAVVVAETTLPGARRARA